jgi:hypothetical protein
MLKLSSERPITYDQRDITPPLGSSIPAQLPKAIEDLRLRLYYTCNQFLGSKSQKPETTSDHNLVHALQTWTAADRALAELRKALEQLDLNLEFGAPIAEMGTQ